MSKKMNTDSESKYLLTDICVDQKSNPLFNSISKQTELSAPEHAQELASEPTSPEKQIDRVNRIKIASINKESSYDGRLKLKEMDILQIHNTSKINLFIIMKELGKGTFSNVYKGKYNGSDCAIKIIRDEERFFIAGEVEASIIVNLSHKNIINILDIFLLNTKHICMVMPIYNTCMYKFSKHPKRKEPSEHDFVFVIRELSHGLMYLDDAGIIHTDIKPENILLNVKDSKIEKVVISDFSNVLEKDKSPNQKEMQTLYYRSPENCFEIQDTRALVHMSKWSLGCMLWEFWTGKVLFNINYKHLRRYEQNKVLLEFHNYVIPFSDKFIEKYDLTKPFKILFKKETICELIKKGDEIYLDCPKVWNNYRINYNIKIPYLYDIIKKLIIPDPEERISYRKILDILCK